MSIFIQWPELLIRFLILAIPGCPEDSLLEWYGYYYSFTIHCILLQIEYISIFVSSCVLFCLWYLFINLSSDAFLLISSRVTGSSRTVLHRVFLISTNSQCLLIILSILESVSIVYRHDSILLIEETPFWNCSSGEWFPIFAASFRMSWRTLFWK